MRVLVNAAMSADGKIALRGAQPLRLSGEADLRRVHELRARCGAVLVGLGTVLADDPALTARGPGLEKQPLRVVLDSKLRMPPNVKVLDGTARTLVFCAEGYARRLPNAEVVEAGAERVDLRLALAALEKRGVQSVLVEGGATVIGAFLRARLVHEMYTYLAPVVVGGGAPSLVEGPGATDPQHVLPLKIEEAKPLGEGLLVKYVPRG